MKNLILFFLIVILSACSGGPPDCDQAMLNRFLRKKSPEVLIENIDGYVGNKNRSEIETFSEATRLTFKATWESYGASVGKQEWKIGKYDELSADTQALLGDQYANESCLVYLESEADGEIYSGPIFSIQIAEEIILPAEESAHFFLWNYMEMEDEEILEDGVPLSP